MENPESFLQEWCVRYLENKDAVKREIASIDRKTAMNITVNYKQGKREFFVMADLDEEDMPSVNESTGIGIFTLNNRSNVSMLAKRWKEFAQHRQFVLYFINPFSKTDKAWIIFPYVHDKICDAASLSRGLTAMAEMVESIDSDALLMKLQG